jgi:acetolactate synthase regulatory subunit
LTSVQRLELEVTKHESVLLRIVSICHQRRYSIVSLSYERCADRARVILNVESRGPQAGRLEVWLANLVHVISVAKPDIASEGGDLSARAKAQSVHVDSDTVRIETGTFS